MSNLTTSALAVVLSIALLGCGNGRIPTTTTTTTPSVKEQYSLLIEYDGVRCVVWREIVHFAPVRSSFQVSMNCNWEDNDG